NTLRYCALLIERNLRFLDHRGPVTPRRLSGGRSQAKSGFRAFDDPASDRLAGVRIERPAQAQGGTIVPASLSAGHRRFARHYLEHVSPPVAVMELSCSSHGAGMRFVKRFTLVEFRGLPKLRRDFLAHEAQRPHHLLVRQQAAAVEFREHAVEAD